MERTCLFSPEWKKHDWSLLCQTKWYWRLRTHLRSPNVVSSKCVTLVDQWNGLFPICLESAPNFPLRCPYPYFIFVYICSLIFAHVMIFVFVIFVCLHAFWLIFNRWIDRGWFQEMWHAKVSRLVFFRWRGLKPETHKLFAQRGIAKPCETRRCYDLATMCSDNFSTHVA